MLTLEAIMTPQPNVLSTDLSNEEMVLLDIASGAYYTLNETGRAIWQGINQAHSLAAISQAIVDQYEITLENAQSSVLALVNELLAENLVTPV